MVTADEALAGSPYVPPDVAGADAAFAKVASRCAEVSDRARTVRQRIAQDASGLLGPFLRLQRGELVAESSQIEDIPVTRDQVLVATQTHRELLDGPAHGLLQAMRADPKLVSALGLYKAQELADEWAQRSDRLRAYEIRQLHALLVGDERIGGGYRSHDVAIGGTKFRPPAHYDVQYAMDSFAEWWTRSRNDPVLDATIAHAWLTHIHPFEDGNGRLARVLANFVLVQTDYPPLIIRAGSDRGEYYDALEASDDGNILPLYELFATIIRRTVNAMSRPGYTHDFLEDRLLASLRDQYSAWAGLVAAFEDQLRKRLERQGWALQHQGVPTAEQFDLLAERNPDGNGWFAVVADSNRQRRFLLWFGYRSDALLQLLGHEGSGFHYPSLFISERDTSDESVHPYRPWQSLPGLPDEFSLKPLEPAPVLLRNGYNTAVYTIQKAAVEFADTFTSL